MGKPTIKIDNIIKILQIDLAFDLTLICAKENGLVGGILR